MQPFTNICSAITQAICDYKMDGGEYGGAFSLDIFLNDSGDYSAVCDFNENYAYIIYYFKNDDNDAVNALFTLSDNYDDIITRIADIAVSNNFICKI